MTTIGNAAFVGVDTAEVAIVPGARADLLLLAANPLDAIGNTRDIAGVIAGGRYLDAAQADELRDALRDPDHTADPRP